MSKVYSDLRAADQSSSSENEAINGASHCDLLGHGLFMTLFATLLDMSIDKMNEGGLDVGSRRVESDKSPNSG